MSSYLLVAIAGGGSCFQIHAPEDCILTELASDVQQGLLHFAFLVQLRVLLFLPGCLGLVIGKEVELLLRRRFCRRFVLRDNVIGNDVEPAKQRFLVGFDFF